MVSPREESSALASREERLVRRFAEAGHGNEWSLLSSLAASCKQFRHMLLVPEDPSSRVFLLLRKENLRWAVDRHEGATEVLRMAMEGHSPIRPVFDSFCNEPNNEPNNEAEIQFEEKPWTIDIFDLNSRVYKKRLWFEEEQVKRYGAREAGGSTSSPLGKVGSVHSSSPSCLRTTSATLTLNLRDSR